MTESESPEFTGCRPVLPVNDLAASVAYYRDALGFEIGWGWPDVESSSEPAYAPSFVYLFRGHFELFLRAHDPPVQAVEIVVGLPSPEAVDRLAEEYRATEARVDEEPSQRPWGTYEMRVLDLDAHCLRMLH